MKLIFPTLLAVGTTCVSLSAHSSVPKLDCADTAVEAATRANYSRFGASASSCGAKRLTAGEYLETFLVCVTDETDPSEWVVVIEKNLSDKNGAVIKTCEVKFADAQYDSETPNFKTEDGLLKTKTCAVDDDGSGTAPVICK